jgi:hypothetical protein
MNGWFSFSRMVRSTKGELLEELTLDVFGLVLADDHVFFKRLHRKNAPVILLPHKVDLAEGSSSDDFDDLEVINGDLFRGVVGV